MNKPPVPVSDRSPPSGRSRWLRRGRKVLGALLVVLLLALLAGWLWWSSDISDPFPAYSIDLDLRSTPDAELRVGAARVDITPAIRETWTDRDGDGVYEPAEGDSFEDADGDGEFDAVWMAGFGTGRAASGVHDPLWARAVVIESGGVRVALVAVDLIGLFHPDVIRIRRALAGLRADGRALVDYALVASTHNHEGPDTMGLWGADEFSSGVDPAYLAQVRSSVVGAIGEAVANLTPARAVFRSTRYGNGTVMHDYRRLPDVVDDTLGVIHFTRADDGRSVATVVNWSNHPETMGDEQTLLTSDFVHWLREGVEKGVGLGGRDPVEGIGGTCIFFNGAIGGMMTTLGLDVPDRESGNLIPETLPDGSRFPWSRAQSVGEHVAAEALRLLAGAGGDTSKAVSALALRVRARTCFVAMTNPLFRLGAKLGRLERGSFEGKIRTEVALIDIGPARLVAVPAEIYPEIVVGGIETPVGSDHPEAPLEEPPLRQALGRGGGGHCFVIGLANDEIGYLIPKREWDAPAGLPWDRDGNPPYLYGADRPPYGEINSCGPDAAREVHEALLSLARGETSGVGP